MITTTKRILAISLIACLAIASLAACAGQQGQQGQQARTNGLSPFASFREIPGVTDQEIADIEALQREYDSFTYGMILSTEAFVKDDGEFGGYAALVCDWLTELFDIPFRIEIYPMNVLLERLDSHEIDFSGVVMTTDEHLERYYMSDIIAERQFVTLRIAGGRDLSQIASERPLRYAFVANTPSEPAVAAVSEPGSYEPVWVNNAMAAYPVLINGDADAFIMSGNNDALFIEYSDVIIEDFFPLIFNPVSMATANPALEAIISVVTKAQQNGANAYLSHLHSQAYQDYLLHKLSVRLTDEERAYLATTRLVPIAAHNTNYPISFYDDRSNQWQGIFFDLLERIHALTGLEFEVAHDETATWADMNELLISGETAFAPQIGWTREREEHFIWSDVLLYHDSFALISHSDYRNIVLNDISNERIGLARGTVFADMFNQWFPNHRNTVVYETQDLAFEGLKRGEVDLVMSTRGRLMYLTHYQELPGFKANFIFDQFTEVRFGFNKNEAILRSIVDKALTLINTGTIVDQWTNKTYDYRAKMAEERMPLLVGISISSAFIVVLVSIMLFRNRIVAKQRAEMINSIRETSSQLEVALVKANAASRAKSDFLANMSHEMRTPLNAIIGMTLIGKKTGETEGKVHALNKIGDASSHLLGIVNDILDMAKIEADMLELSPVEFDFERMLEKVLNVIHFRADEKQHTVTVSIDKEIPRFIIGDDQRLAQAVTNLLANAVKFTPEGGSVHLDVSLAGELSGQCELRVEVTDSGIGISPAQLDKLFDAFEQADAGISREYGGTGLGLTITKRIVELMGGRIWAESELGKGAKFIFTVKVKTGSKDENASSIEAVYHGSFSDKRLLVAEDVEINREILVALLEDSGLIIDCAENGKEALDMVAADLEKYDIVFMDLQMPQMGGLEATRHIRALPARQRGRLPIVAMTANVFQDDIDACLAAGMDDYLGKPLDIDKVLDVLRKYLIG